MIPRARNPRQEPQQHTLARTFRHNGHISAYFDQRYLTQFDVDLLFDEDLLQAISFILDVGENCLGTYSSSIYTLAMEYAILMRMVYATLNIFLQGEIELYNLDISGSIREFTTSMHDKLQAISEGRRYIINAIEDVEWALHEVRTKYHFSRVHGFCVFENDETPGTLCCTNCFSSNIANHLMNIKQVLQEYTSWLPPHVLFPAALLSHISSVLENPYLTGRMRSQRRNNLRRFQVKWSQMRLNSIFDGTSEWKSIQVYTLFRKFGDLSELYLRTNQLLPSFQLYCHRVHQSTAFTTCPGLEESGEYDYNSDSDHGLEMETSCEINAIGVKFLSTWRPSRNREQAEFGRANMAGRRNYTAGLENQPTCQVTSSRNVARQYNQQRNANGTRRTPTSSTINWKF